MLNVNCEDVFTMSFVIIILKRQDMQRHKLRFPTLQWKFSRVALSYTLVGLYASPGNKQKKQQGEPVISTPRKMSSAYI